MTYTVAGKRNHEVQTVLHQISTKWSVLILATLCLQPRRFNYLKRELNGITQKALTDALRRLERNGLVTRRVIPSSPIAVEYSLTSLGHSLEKPFRALCEWSVAHQSQVEEAQALFDTRK